MYKMACDEEFSSAENPKGSSVRQIQIGGENLFTDLKKPLGTSQTNFYDFFFKNKPRDS